MAYNNRPMSPEDASQLREARLASADQAIERAQQGKAAAAGNEEQEKLWQKRLEDAEKAKQDMLDEAETSIAA